MKFFICVLALFVLNAESSVVPLALNSPLLYSAAYGSGIIFDNSSPSVVLHSSAIQPPVHLYSSPLIVPVGLNAEASYVAKTPGSEHIASLPGHFISTSSINLEQAPGTNDNKIITKDSNSLAPSVAIHGSVFPASAFPLTYSSLIIPPASIVLPTEAKYIARNLGVEHVAPLPGHSISATSLNLQPAPGSQ